MQSVEFSQDELKIIVGLLLQLNFKLPDAIVVHPIVEKLQSHITPDPEPVEGETVPSEPPAPESTN